MSWKFVEVKKGKAVCVVDNVGGSYLPIAMQLANHFDKVYYHSVNQNPFPRMSLDQIGKGYKQINRIDEFWNQLDLFDVIVFPDIYFMDWGDHLRKLGKQVWGGTNAEQLETNRKLFKQELSSVGLKVAPTKYIMGVNNLVKELKSSQDKWVKMSYYRGEGETTKHINWNQSEIMIDQMNYEMGPLAETAEFCLEDNIDSVAEIGYDGWTINGQMSKGQIWGIEVKDCGYVGKASTYTEMPTPLKQINDKFNPVLQKYGHTGFYSTEVRYGKDQNTYYTDPCVRGGSPPSNVYMKMISNWQDIITQGCMGEIVEPKFTAKYGVELILKSNYCNSNTLPVMIPNEYRDNVNLKGSYYLNGKDYIIPFSQGGIKDMEAFGSVVAVGDDLDSTMKQALTIAKSLEAPGLYYNENSLSKAKMQLNDLNTNLGIEF